MASLGGEHASFFKRALVCSGNSKFVNDAVDVIRGRPMGLVTDEFNLGVFKFSQISLLSETFFFWLARRHSDRGDQRVVDDARCVD